MPLSTDPHHIIFSEDLQQNAIDHAPCNTCGAPVGAPCVSAKNFEVQWNSKVHDSRWEHYTGWVIAYYHNYRAARKEDES